MTPLQIVAAVIAVAFIALLAWCEDVRSREVAKVAEPSEPGMDDYIAEHLHRCVVNGDGTVARIDQATNPYWTNQSAFTPEQWARAGEHACRVHMEAVGLTPTEADLQEARGAAVQFACGYRINSAIPGRDECGDPSGQVDNSPHSVNGLPPGGGPEVVPAGVGMGDGATTPGRGSGEVGGHVDASRMVTGLRDGADL